MQGGGTAQDRKLLEVEQTMVRQLKQQNYEEALDAANAALCLNPGNKRNQEFARLLQELIAEREDDTTSSESESEGSDVEPSSDQQQARADGEEGASGSSEEGSEEDSEGSTSEEDDPQPSSTAADDAAKQISSLSLDTTNTHVRTSHATRQQLRASIGASLKKLQQQQQMQSVTEDDPLLGA